MRASEIIFLVHGTFAQKEGEAGKEKWWQPESIFAANLKAGLASKRPEIEYDLRPLKWSGNNSEADRRSESHDVLNALVECEKEGTSYHLICHSHGGSVLWHALQKATAGRKYLAKLASWTTVGTPYLDFVPRSAWYLVSCLAVVITSLVLLSNLMAPGIDAVADHRVLAREIAWYIIVPLVLLPLGLCTLTLYGLWLALGYWGARARKTQINSWANQASARYGHRTLLLWHKYDEPINGLGSTTAPAPQIAMRRSTESDGKGQTISVPWANLVPNFIDSFVWWISAGRLQGRDVAHEVLKRCAPVPYGFAQRANGLPGPSQDKMSEKADIMSADAVRTIRQTLHEFSRREKDLSSFGDAITWQEVLHTSYFDHKEIAQQCAEHIANAPPEEQLPSNEDANEGTAIKSESAKAETSAAHFEPRSLYLLASLAVIGVSVLATLAGLAAWEAFGRPLTARYQIDAIADNAFKPSFSRLWDSPEFGKLAARLVAIDRLTDPLGLVRAIDSPNTQAQTAQSIAYALGYFGKLNLLNEFNNGNGAPALIASEAQVALHLRAFALAGALDADQPIAHDLAHAVHRRLYRTDDFDLFAPYSSPSLWFVQLLRAGHGESLLKRAEKWTCEQIKQAIGEAYRLPPGASKELAPLKQRCPNLKTEVPVAAPDAPVKADDYPELKRFMQGGQQNTNPYTIAGEVKALLKNGDIAVVRQFVRKWNAEDERRYIDAFSFETIYELEKAFSASDPPLGQKIRSLFIRHVLEEADSRGIIKLTHAVSYAEAVAEHINTRQKQALFGELAHAYDQNSTIEKEQRLLIGGMFWREAGERAKALERLESALALLEQRPSGELGFPNLMLVAKHAHPISPDLTRRAVQAAHAALGHAFKADSVRDYTFSIDDAVYFLALTGEFKAARDLSENIGRPLAPLEPSAQVDDNIALEKAGLQGGGVLGGYQRLIDGWIDRYGTQAAKNFVGSRDDWPSTFGMTLNVFNRGS